MTEQTREQKMQKFLHCAQADYEALYRDKDMIEYLAWLLETLHTLDPENHNIDDHWAMVEEREENQ